MDKMWNLEYGRFSKDINFELKLNYGPSNAGQVYSKWPFDVGNIPSFMSQIKFIYPFTFQF